MAMKTMMALALVTAAPSNCLMPNVDEEGRLLNISPAALAALPPGVDPAFLIRDENGCYGIQIEVTDPPSGPALLDKNGNAVCDPVAAWPFRSA